VIILIEPSHKEAHMETPKTNWKSPWTVYDRVTGERIDIWNVSAWRAFRAAPKTCLAVCVLGTLLIQWILS
jgi:hypothetical protein